MGQLDNDVCTNLKSTCVAYFGDITIKVTDARGVQKGKTQHFKNKGRWPLFLFLTTCLDGNYNTAENMRPRYIELFHSAETTDPLVNITDAESSASLKDYFTEDKRRTLITYAFNEDTHVDAAKTEGSNYKNLGNSIITYKFTIPFAHIKAEDAINGIALYSAENYQNYGEPSAYFFVKNEDEIHFGSLLGTTSTNKNYNLIIEWALTLQNVTQTNS